MRSGPLLGLMSLGAFAYLVTWSLARIAASPPWPGREVVLGLFGVFVATLLVSSIPFVLSGRTSRRSKRRILVGAGVTLLWTGAFSAGWAVIGLYHSVGTGPGPAQILALGLWYALVAVGSAGLTGAALRRQWVRGLTPPPTSPPPPTPAP